MQTNPITKIDKAQLLNKSFHSKTSANSSFDINKDNLKYKLQRALKLGNLYKTSVAIRFISDQELLETQATIWAVTDNYIMLKGGVMIPIDCIIDLDV